MIRKIKYDVPRFFLILVITGIIFSDSACGGYTVSGYASGGYAGDRYTGGRYAGG